MAFYEVSSQGAEEDSIQEWRSTLYSDYEFDTSGPTESIRAIDNILYKTIVSNDISCEELDAQLQEWIDGLPSMRNIFANTFAKYRSADIYRALLIWERRTSPFLGIQDKLSSEQFDRFLGFLYKDLPQIDWREFENFHPERRDELSPHRRSADPGLIMPRRRV